MNKCCDTCIMYQPPQKAFTRGTCIYPVPEWLRDRVAGGNFIDNSEYDGINCDTYKRAADTPPKQGD